MKRVDPTKGGCWYCYTEAETGDWLFSWEFDTHLHEQCLRMAVDMWNDPETDIFKNEFKDLLMERKKYNIKDLAKGMNAQNSHDVIEF